MASYHPSTTPRASESINRTNKVFKWGAIIASLFVLMLLLAIPNYLRDLARQAHIAWNIVGIVLIAASAYVAYNAYRWAGTAAYFLVWLILLALGICAACGWDFDLRGIPERP